MVVVSVVPDFVPIPDDQSRFRRALSITLANEGGASITNDADDPGGLTKWGISQRAFPDLDIQNLTFDGAAAIYLATYWRPIRADDLPESLAIKLFDFAVNFGVSRASTMLQRSLNVLAGTMALSVDGRIGGVTVAAVSAERDPDALLCIVRYFAARHYVELGRTKYIRGWIKRAFA